MSYPGNQTGGYGYGQQKPQGYGQQGGYAAPPQQGGYGNPPQQGGYGAPQQQGGGYGYGQHQQQGGYGAPQQQGGYGAPPPQGSYGAASQPQGGYGGSQPQQGGYGGPQSQQGGYNSNNSGPGVGNSAPIGLGAGMRGDPKLLGWFQAVDTDRTGSITPQELQRALSNGDWSHFSLDTVTLMMSLFDTDKSMTIGFNEFCDLWYYIEDWKRIFQQFDRDRSGRIDHSELKSALSAFGYSVSDKVVSTLIRKHARNAINFDSFIICCVNVKSLSDAFQRVDNDRDGWVNMSQEMFLDIVIASKP